MLKVEQRILRILCADDESMILSLFQRALSDEGHFVACAPDGQAAFRKFQSGDAHFDLVITDNNMPNMNGLELVKCLSACGFQGKVIVVSSALSENEIIAYKKFGANRIMRKPILPSELKQVVNELFS